MSGRRAQRRGGAAAWLLAAAGCQLGAPTLEGAEPATSQPPAADAAATATTGQNEAQTEPQAAATTPKADTTPAISAEGDGLTVLAPPYTPSPYVQEPRGVPAGTLHDLTIGSVESKIYRGNDPGLRQPGDFSRQVWLWVPAQLAPGAEAPFIVVQDGGGHLGVARALANLIGQQKLPPMLAVFINPGPGDGPGSQRGLEYDTVSGTYARFVESEILPLLSDRFAVQFTQNPEGGATYGGSSGGAAAFTMAWFRPERFRRVLSWSGTFVNQHPDPDTAPYGAWSYHDNLIAQRPPLGLRVFLQVGENDNSFGDGYHSWPIANHRMQVILAAKGYHTRFLFCREAGHVDGRVLDAQMPAALMWLWRGYPGVADS